MKQFFVNWETYFNTITARFGIGFLYENGQPAVRWDNYYELKYDEIKLFFEELDSLDTITLRTNWLDDFDDWVVQGVASSFDNIPDEDQSSIPTRYYIPSTDNPVTGACD